MANKLTYVIYRTLTGKTLFNGIIGKQAKVKVLDATDNPKNANKFKAKFTSLVSNIDENKKSQLKIEHCEVRFLTEADRNNFIQVFEQQTNTDKEAEGEPKGDTEGK